MKPMLLEVKIRKEQYIDQQLAVLEAEKKRMLEKLQGTYGNQFDGLFELYVTLSYKLEELKEKRVSGEFDMEFELENDKIDSIGTSA